MSNAMFKYRFYATSNRLKYVFERCRCFLEGKSENNVGKTGDFKDVFLMRTSHQRFNPRETPPGNRNSVKTGLFILGASYALLQKLNEEESIRLANMIKHAESLNNISDKDKMVELYESALKIAQNLKLNDKVTFIYDKLANLAYESGKHDKAATLFTIVLQRLMQEGAREDDPAFIHISFKLAKIFEYLEQYEKAEIGYEFCYDKLKGKVERAFKTGDSNVILLWIMTLEGYGYYCYQREDLKGALELFEKARTVSERYHGRNHEQTALLLNNLGAVCESMNEPDEAIKYFKAAVEIERGLTTKMETFSYVHLNLGLLYLQKGMLNEAKSHCNKAWRNAAAYKNHHGIAEADDCLDKIKEKQKTNPIAT